MAKKRKPRKRTRSQPDALSALAPQQRLQPSNRTGNKLAQAQNRWQRTVRYVWDKKRG